MTKDDLLLAMQILITNNKDPKDASDLIWTLWMDHANYQISNGRIIYKKNGSLLGSY